MQLLLVVSASRNCVQVHQDPETGFWEFPRSDHSSRRAMIAQNANISRVHLIEISHFFQEHVDMDNVLQVGVHGCEHDLERAQYLCGLAEDIGADKLPCFGINPADTSNRNDLPDLCDMTVRADQWRAPRWRQGLNSTCQWLALPEYLCAGTDMYGAIVNVTESQRIMSLWPREDRL